MSDRQPRHLKNADVLGFVLSLPTLFSLVPIPPDFQRLPPVTQQAYVQAAAKLVQGFNHLAQAPPQTRRAKVEYKQAQHNIQKLQVQRAHVVRKMENRAIRQPQKTHIKASLRNLGAAEERQNFASSMKLSGHKADAVAERRTARRDLTQQLLTHQAKQIESSLGYLGKLVPDWVKDYSQTAFLKGVETQEVLTNTVAAISDLLRSSVENLNDQQKSALLKLDSNSLQHTPLEGVVENLKNALGKKGLKKFELVNEWVNKQIESGILEGSQEEIYLFLSQAFNKFANINSELALLLPALGLTFAGVKLRNRYVVGTVAALVLAHSLSSYVPELYLNYLANPDLQVASAQVIQSNDLGSTGVVADDGGGGSSPSPTPTLTPTPIAQNLTDPPGLTPQVWLPMVSSNKQATSVPQNLAETTPTATPIISVNFEPNAKQVMFDAPGSGGIPTSFDPKMWQYTGFDHGDFFQIIKNDGSGQLGWVAKKSVDNDPLDTRPLRKDKLPLMVAKKLLEKPLTHSGGDVWTESAVKGSKSININGVDRFAVTVGFGSMKGSNGILIVGKDAPELRDRIRADVISSGDGYATLAIRNGQGAGQLVNLSFKLPDDGMVTIVFTNGGRDIILKGSNNETLVNSDGTFVPSVDLPRQANLQNGLFPNGDIDNVSIISGPGAQVQIDELVFQTSPDGKFTGDQTPTPQPPPPTQPKPPTKEPVSQIQSIIQQSPPETLAPYGIFGPNEAPYLRRRGEVTPIGFAEQAIRDGAPEAIIQQGHQLEELRWTTIRDITQNKAGQLSITYSYTIAEGPDQGKIITTTEPLLGNADNLLFGGGNDFFSARQMFAGAGCILYRDVTSSEVIGCQIVPPNVIRTK